MHGSALDNVYMSNFPILVNGNTYSPKLPILNYQDRTYLPLREFADITGNDVDFSNNTIIVNSSTNSVITEEKDIYEKGDSPSLDGLQITIDNVKTKSYYEYYQPKTGYEYVTVYFTLKNISDSNISYNPYYFSMQNSNGQITDHDFASYNNESHLSSGQLAPGGQISATLTFEEPKKDKGLIFIYKPSSIYEKSLKIKLY